MSLEVANAVMESYTQLEQEIATFQLETGLRCPSGCGQCCESPDVETTPLELIPLVLELFREGTVDQWLELAEQAGFRGHCVFYAPDPRIAENGRCQVYPWRPTICRLFGFATVTDKTGAERLAACVRHKAVMADTVAQAQRAIAQGTAQAPNFADATQQIIALDPTLGQQRWPINEALKITIEKVGLWLQMSAEATPPQVA